ncbi:MAG: hypothetical protein ACR2IJ_00485 [Fluviibacter sp.]
MKKWIALNLFRMAVKIDFGTVTEEARILVFIADLVDEMRAPPKKRGRPLGSKDSVGPKKVGRPLGSKDKQPRKSSKTPA